MSVAWPGLGSCTAGQVPALSRAGDLAAVLGAQCTLGVLGSFGVQGAGRGGWEVTCNTSFARTCDLRVSRGRRMLSSPDAVS